MYFYQHIKTVVPWVLGGKPDRQLGSFPSKCGRKNQKSNKRRWKLGTLEMDRTLSEMDRRQKAIKGVNCQSF